MKRTFDNKSPDVCTHSEVMALALKIGGGKALRAS